MIEARVTLWFMLLSGVIIHSIVLSNINISMPGMVKRRYNKFENISKSSSDACHIKFDDNITTVNPVKTESIQSPKVSKTGMFNWTENQQTMILSSHYYVSGISHFFGGYLAHKYGAKLVWGYSTLLLGLVSLFVPMAAYSSYAHITGIRVLQGILAGLGIGGGPAVLVAKWVPPYHRAKYMITMLGLPLGISLSYSVYGYVIHWFGWEYTFYISGCVSLLWCVFCYYFIYDTPTSHPRISANELKLIKSTVECFSPKEKLPVPWKSILTSKPFIVNILCKVGIMWCLFTFSVFTPIYFSSVHRLSIEKNGVVSGLPFFLKTMFAAFASVSTEYLLQKDILRKTNVRKLAVLISSVIGGLLLFCVPLTGCNTTLTITFLAVTLTLNGGAAAGIIPNTIDMSPNYAGILEGISGFMTSFTGFISPIVISYMIRDNTMSQWNSVFMLSGLLYFVPGVLFLIYADSEPQPWNNPMFGIPKESHFLKSSNKNVEELIQ